MADGEPITAKTAGARFFSMETGWLESLKNLFCRKGARAKTSGGFKDDTGSVPGPPGSCQEDRMIAGYRRKRLGRLSRPSQTTSIPFCVGGAFAWQTMGRCSAIAERALYGGASIDREPSGLPSLSPLSATQVSIDESAPDPLTGGRRCQASPGQSPSK